MRGSISLYNFKGNSYYTVYAGGFNPSSYDKTGRPPSMIGVSLLEQRNPKNFPEIHIPTADFQLPPVDRVNAALKEVLRCLSVGLSVYVGCGAGQGRTGTFLGILAKAWGIKDPINYVRDNYLSENKGTSKQPIETDAQEDFITGYKIPLSVRWAVFKLKLAGYFKEGTLTNL